MGRCTIFADCRHSRRGGELGFPCAMTQSGQSNEYYDHSTTETSDLFRVLLLKLYETLQSATSRRAPSCVTPAKCTATYIAGADRQEALHTAASLTPQGDVQLNMHASCGASCRRRGYCRGSSVHSVQSSAVPAPRDTSKYPAVQSISSAPMHFKMHFASCAPCAMRTENGYIHYPIHFDS